MTTRKQPAAPMLGGNTHPSWVYEPGAVRWRRLKNGDSTRGDGWERVRRVCASHPTTGEPFQQPQLWIRETKI